ncbi:MAG: universal stress protein [Allomuricauda sp.]
MKPILCATDCSENSVAALKMGRTLSIKLKTKLVVLHVFDLSVALLTPLSTTYIKLEKEAFERHREKLTDFCKTHFGAPPDGRGVQIVVRENAITNNAIVEVLTDFDASMVIMGTKGRSVLKDKILGSNTKGMIKKSPCPVLMVPPTTDKFLIERITHASDFGEVDIHAIDWIIKTVACPYRAFVKIIHVNIMDWEIGEEKMQRFKKILDQKVRYDKLGFELIHSERIFDALVQYAERGEMDTLVMLERNGKDIVPSLAHPDFVRKMMSRVQVPLLSMNKSMFH